MPTWGLYVRNQQNKIVIDQDYLSYAPLHTPTYFTATGGLPTGALDGTFFYFYSNQGYPYLTVNWPSGPRPSYGASPLLFTQSHYAGAFPTMFDQGLGYVSAFGVTFKGSSPLNTYAGYCWAVDNRYAPYPSGSTWDPGPNDRWGLQIFKSTGVQAFDSRKPQIIIRDVITANPPILGEQYVAHNACSGTPWYAISYRPSPPYAASTPDDHISPAVACQVYSQSIVHTWRLKQGPTDTGTVPAKIIVADII